MSEIIETTDLQENSQPQRSISKIALLALLLSLVALIANVVVYYKNKQQTHQITHHFNQALTNNVDILQTDITHLKTQQIGQQALMMQTKKIIMEIQQNVDSGTQQWQLSRIDYLLRLANYQLLYLHDLPTAVALLHAAKIDVIQANKPQWLTLANAIQQDLDSLNALPNTPISDLLSQLSGIDSQIDDLPLITTPAHQIKPTPVKTEIETNHANLNMKQWIWWKLQFKKVWDELRHILVIRHHGHDIAPLIDPVQKQYLRENLHLLIFQTKWAVLQHDNKTYQAGLTQLSTWLHHYFDIDAKQTDSILHNIHELQKTNLIRTLPTIDHSLTAFDQLRQSSQPRSNFTKKNDKTKLPLIIHSTPQPNVKPTSPPHKKSSRESIEVTES